MKRKCFKKGDTIIEILFAVTIFSAIAVSSLAVMNKGLASAQTALEETVTRTEIDAEAERIRFIHDSYAAGGDFKELWTEITDGALKPSGSKYNAFIDHHKNTTCSSDSSNGNIINDDNAFLLKTDLNDIYRLPISKYNQPTSTPSVREEKGIWVVAVKGNNKDEIEDIPYYDFYINTCWFTPGSKTGTTLRTIIRLQNPDYVPPDVT